MMQTHFCRLLITGDGDAHNPVSGQASVKAEDELSKYVVARCCARMQIVLSLKSKRPPTKQISYEETVVCIVMPLQLKHPALLENMLKMIDAIRPLPLSTYIDTAVIHDEWKRNQIRKLWRRFFVHSPQKLQGKYSLMSFVKLCLVTSVGMK